MLYKLTFFGCLILLMTGVGLLHAQVTATNIVLSRGQLWETINVAKIGPTFRDWGRLGFGMDYPGYDPDLIPEDIGGGNSHHLGGGFWIGARRPSTPDTVWAVEDWAMFAGSVGLSETDSRYLLKRHGWRWPNGENYWLQTDPLAGEEVVDTEWIFNPHYRFPFQPPRFLPVRVKRTVHTWSGSTKDENYIVIDYVITNVARDSNIFNSEEASPEVYRILQQDSTLADLYLTFTYAMAVNNRGWNVKFPQLGSGAQNNRFLYDNRRRLLYGWADDYIGASGNDKFDPYTYEAGGPPGKTEWLAPAYAGLKFLFISRNKLGRENLVGPIAWSVSEPRASFPFTGLSTPELWYAAMQDPSKAYQPILFPQGLGDSRWGQARMWSMMTLGPWDLAPGDSIRVVMAEVVGSVDYAKAVDARTTEQQIATGRDSLFANSDRAQFNFDHGYNVPDPPAAPPSFQLSRLTGAKIGNVLTWPDAAEAIPDRDYTGEESYDLAGYRLYRSGYLPFGPFVRLAEIRKGEAPYYDAATRAYTFADTTVNVGFRYYYAITSFDTGHDTWPPDTRAIFPETRSNRVPVLESSKYPNHTATPFVAAFAPVNATLSEILVVPNPFVTRSGFVTPGSQDVISFVNIPSPCTIRIYTVRGDLVKTIEHRENIGIAQWNQVTDFGQFAESGFYLFHLTSHAPETKGKTKIGKFAIVR